MGGHQRSLADSVGSGTATFHFTLTPAAPFQHHKSCPVNWLPTLREGENKASVLKELWYWPKSAQLTFVGRDLSADPAS